MSKLAYTVQDPAFDFIGGGCECCGKVNLGSAQKLISIYLARSGTLEPCINAHVAYAEMRDEKAGDDTFWWPNQMMAGVDFSAEYTALPRCRNDSEFGFVRGMLLEN